MSEDKNPLERLLEVTESRHGKAYVINNSYHKCDATWDDLRAFAKKYRKMEEENDALKIEVAEHPFMPLAVKLNKQNLELNERIKELEAELRQYKPIQASKREQKEEANE